MARTTLPFHTILVQSIEHATRSLEHFNSSLLLGGWFTLLVRPPHVRSMIRSLIYVHFSSFSSISSTLCVLPAITTSLISRQSPNAHGEMDVPGLAQILASIIEREIACSFSRNFRKMQMTQFRAGHISPMLGSPTQNGKDIFPMNKFA